MSEVYIEGGRRCAIRLSEYIPDWWVGTSPRNGDDAQCEGSWEDWVTLAHAILVADAKRKQLLLAPPISEEINK